MDRKKIGIGAGVVVAVLAIGGGVAALAGGSNTAAPGTSTTQTGKISSTTTAANVGPVAPLTGLPQPDEALRNRPLLTVKIDNSPDARPQFGLENADDVVEEKVEGSLSRFMALFQSKDADPLGPVRSLRTTDAAWLKPEGGMIAYSGGIPTVEALLQPAGISDIGGDRESAKYYKRRSDRPFEHSMYVQTPVLRELTPAGLPAPKPLYHYLNPGEPFGGTTATPLTTGVAGPMGPGGGATQYAWKYDPSTNKWFRSTDGQPHLIENVGQISMTNVILQYTQYRPTQYHDRANSVVDEAVTTGSGDAWILSGGKLVQGHWSRPTENDITSFTDPTGAEVKIAPGQTWLQLVPQDYRATVTP